MSQKHLNIGAAPNDHTGTNRRVAWSYTEDNFTDLYSIQSRTVNAGDVRFQGGATTEARIQLAINQAVIELATAVYVPAFMLPYDASLVTFNTSIQMTREGGTNDVYDVRAYGAPGATGTDWYSCMAAGLAAAANNGTCYFPPGRYQLTQAMTFTGIGDTQFVGAGGNASQIVMYNANAHCLNFEGTCTRIVIHDLWLGTFNAPLASGFGLRIVATGTPSDTFRIYNVTVQNIPTAVYIENLHNSAVDHIRVFQTVAGASTATYPAFTVVNSQSTTFTDVILFATTGTFGQDGIVVDYDCDTVIFINSQALQCAGYGFRALQSAGSTGPRLCRWTNCFSESNTLGGFYITAARDFRLNGCHAAVNGGNGYFINGGTSVTLTDCLALQNQQHGFYLATGTGMKLDGCTASNNSQQTNATYDGIVIGASGTRVTGNRSGDFVFTLTNKQRAGLNLQAGTDFLYVGANDLQGNTGQGFSQPILNNSTGANNQFFGSRFQSVSEAYLVAGVDSESLDNYIETTLSAARVVGALNYKFKGQRVVFTFIQNGTGGWAVTWNAVYKHSWVDTGNTASKRSSIAFVFDGTNWNQDGAQTPYI